jgi:hypothetical protein
MFRHAIAAQLSISERVFCDEFRILQLENAQLIIIHFYEIRGKKPNEKN